MGRSLGEGKCYPLQYSGLENSMDCIVQGVAKSQTWLSDFHTLIAKSFDIWIMQVYWYNKGFPGDSDSKESAMQESLVWSLAWEDPLEKELVTHSSILAWRILWIEEPGGLQSMGSQRGGCNWVTNTLTCTILQRRKGSATWGLDRALKEHHLGGNISAFQETGKSRGRCSRQRKQHCKGSGICQRSRDFRSDLRMH